MGQLGKLNYVEYVYDFAVDGGATGAVDLSAKNNKGVLPDNAIVKTVYMVVNTTFTSGGSATLAWGNTTDPDGYSGSAIAVGSLTAGTVFNGWDNGAALLWDDTNDHAIYYNVGTTANNKDFSCTIGTAAMTAGKATFIVEFVVPAVDS